MGPPAESEHYARLMALLAEARALEPAGQASLLAEVAADEPELARELAALLRHEQGLSVASEETVQQLAELTAGVAGRRAAGGAEEEALFPARDLEFVSTLAEGGMGRVMLARQRSLHREVAVKVLKQGRASPALVSGLLQEAVVCGSLEHPNIVPVHVLGLDDKGLPLLVMKRVEGVAWATLVDEPDHPAWQKLPGAEKDRLGAHLSILMSICNALGYAHSRGVLHCDLKPQNVMVGAFGEVYLVDWGIAQHTAGGEVVLPPGGLLGTPGFMAPEMASDDARRLDARTDVYLLGATLHYALTGRPRHGGRTAIQRVMQAQRSAPADYGPEVPEELGAICNRATDADPARRYPTPAALSAAVSEFLRHRGSIELSEGAAGRLAQLQAALCGAKDEDPRRLHELMTECQFGFQESLRAWPENPRAGAGLRECLQVMIRYEVRQQNLSRAQALLAQLAGPPSDLVAAVAALREELALREQREERLRELERQRDWTTASRPRAAFLVVAFGLACAVWRYAIHDAGPSVESMPPERMAFFLGVGVALVCAGVLLLRRFLFRTGVTRALVLGMICCFFGMLVSRVLFVIPVPLVAATVSTDLVLAATAAAVGAVTLAGWLWLAVPIFLAGAVAARLSPPLAGEAMAASLGLALLVSLLCLPRRGAPGPSGVSRGSGSS